MVEHVTPRFGATPEEWAHFDLVLGLTQDLLPVVSNPGAKISPQSKMAALGKTPSRYNKAGFAAGVVDWTSHVSTPAMIDTWSAQPDYGICVQTRTVRAIDCDITDPFFAGEVHNAIVMHTGLSLPHRFRVGSPKFLLAFTLPGELAKRVIRAPHGVIEFLATGQQFVAVGTHPSGTRYQWAGGLPSSLPALTLEQFGALWAHLAERFGVGEPSTSAASVKHAKLSAAAENDPIASALEANNLVISSEKDGRLHIECPFSAEHTGPSAESATTYWPAHTGGYERGHFHCLHAHCAERTDAEFLQVLGLAEDPRDDFEAVDPVPSSSTIVPSLSTPARFAFIDDDAFAGTGTLPWIVKGVLPAGELGVVYGAPGSGKSFFTYDLAMAVAQGLPWCGHRVTRLPVGYVVAEGAAGFKGRVQAYRMQNDVPPGALKVLAAVPSLLNRQQVTELAQQVKAAGIKLLVYDTLARGTAGADENSAKDMGVAIAHCRLLHDATGAMVVLIHHSGKDPTKGARGSNAVLGAVDVEIEVSREDTNRTATITKMKDGEDGQKFGFRLAVVQLGLDEEGDPVTSCVLEHGEAVTTRKMVGAKGPHELMVLRIVREMQGLDGTWPTVKELIDRCVTETPFDEGSDKRDRRREVLGRALDTLVGSGRLQVIAGRVTVPE